MVKIAVFRFFRKKCAENQKRLRDEKWFFWVRLRQMMMFCSATIHQTLDSVCGAKSQTSLPDAATGSWTLGSTCLSCTSSPSASVWSYRWQKQRLQMLTSKHKYLNQWYSIFWGSWTLYISALISPSQKSFDDWRFELKVWLWACNCILMSEMSEIAFKRHLGTFIPSLSQTGADSFNFQNLPCDKKTNSPQYLFAYVPKQNH